MSLTACYYRLLGFKYLQRYGEYTMRMIVMLLAGVCLLSLLAWLLIFSVDDAKSATAMTGKIAASEANLARSAAKHAWNQYRRYSWGANELAPGSMASSNVPDQLVGRKSGLTIVEGLATLHLMELDEQFLQAKQWIGASFDFTNTTEAVSTSETSSRLLGSLLSAFSLTEHPTFLYKALQVAEGLLIAFKTPSGLPASVVVPFQGPTAAGRFVRLDQMAQLYLEFAFLHKLTGLKKYGDAAAAILAPLTRHLAARTEEISSAMRNETGRTSWSPPNVWDARTGAPQTTEWNISGIITLAEVAIKAHLLLGGDRSALHLFQGLLSGRLHLDAWLNCQPVKGVECRFDLTVCRMVETLLLSMGQSRDPIVQRDLAHQLGDLCLSSMQLGEVSLSSDQLLLRRSTLSSANGYWLAETANAHYAAQPEPVLAGLLLWSRRRRLDHQRLLSLTLHSIAERLRGPNGFQGLRRMTGAPSSGQNSGLLRPDNRQPSYLLGQTLKYIYMAFKPSPLNLVSGDWMFNTAGQLLPVCSGRQFDRLRQVVHDNWPEVRRQLGDLAILQLNRRRKGLGMEYDGWARAGSVRSRESTTWLVVVAATLLAVVAQCNL